MILKWGQKQGHCATYKIQNILLSQLMSDYHFFTHYSFIFILEIRFTGMPNHRGVCVDDLDPVRVTCFPGNDDMLLSM